MRLLYVDIDSLRSDHLGTYGYHRDTSPNIDALAAGAIRFDGCYASDTPCLPSRTALITGRFGIHNGVMSHGGVAGDPYIEGPGRGFQSSLGLTSWVSTMRQAGLYTASISGFPMRHSAFQWCSGFHELHDLGRGGSEIAGEVLPPALDWLDRRGRDEDWFLHLNFWDPHTPYRTPMSYGEPFAAAPPPAWYTEEVRRRHWDEPGPHSAQEMIGFDSGEMVTKHFPLMGLHEEYPRQPLVASSLVEARRMFDGYDTAVRYVDEHIGRLLDKLDELGILDETAVMLSADHGENLGELNIYGDHHTADEHTSHLPLILKWPGLPGGRVETGLHYQIDVAATVLELLGCEVPPGWDGLSFAAELRGADAAAGRPHLVLSHGAHTVQRSVRFGDLLLIRTYHTAYHPFPELMLFDLAADPHEQVNLARERPADVAAGLELLAEWTERELASSPYPDPLETVLREGGGWHARGDQSAYLERLRATGRGGWADLFAAAPGAPVDLV